MRVGLKEFSDTELRQMKKTETAVKLNENQMFRQLVEQSFCGLPSDYF